MRSLALILVAVAASSCGRSDVFDPGANGGGANGGGANGGGANGGGANGGGANGGGANGGGANGGGANGGGANGGGTAGGQSGGSAGGVASTFTVSGFSVPSEATAVIASASVGLCAANTCKQLPFGAGVQLAAPARAGYELKQWSSNCGGGAADPLSLVVSTDLSCTAFFRVRHTGALTGAGSGTLTATSNDPTGRCSGSTCWVDPASTVTFTVTPGYAATVTKWVGCTATANPNVATLTAGSSPGTCTAHLELGWAVSLGLPGGEREMGEALALSADGGTLSVLGSTSNGVWLTGIDPTTGAVQSSLIIEDAQYPVAVRSAGSDTFVLAQRVSPDEPLLVRLSPAGSPQYAVQLPFSKPGLNVSLVSRGELFASSDGTARVVTVVRDTTGAATTSLTRLTTLDGMGAAVSDTLITGTCAGERLEAYVAADLPSHGTVLVFYAGAHFYVVSVDLLGALRWSRKVTMPASGNPLVATAWGSGGVAIGGWTSPSTGNIDAFFVAFDAAGNAPWPGRVLRAAGARHTTISSGAADPAGGIVFGGAVASVGPDTDLWLLRVSSTGALEEQTIYGGPVFDYGYALHAAPDGLYLTGHTQSFGVGGDVWVLRTGVEGQLSFPSGSPARSTPTTATVVGSLTVAPTSCLSVTTTSPVATRPVTVTITRPTADFRRQAP